MSTRCNVVLKDSFGQTLYFYRHSDGYPTGVTPTLMEFLSLVKKGFIRDNVCQAGGWLILLGQEEYVKYGSTLENVRSGKEWKCGAYEPTTGIHGDVDYIYTIDLATKKITTKKAY